MSSSGERCHDTPAASAKSAAAALAARRHAKRAAARVAIHPRNSADPILPQPTRTSVRCRRVVIFPGHRATPLASGFADRVDHRGGDRLGGRLPPHSTS